MKALKFQYGPFAFEGDFLTGRGMECNGVTFNNELPTQT